MAASAASPVAVLRDADLRSAPQDEVRSHHRESAGKGKAMADISLEAVAGKLNRVGYEAFFKALRQAKGAGNRNVELAHWLVHILQGERSDIALTADHFKLDRGKLMTDVTAVASGFQRRDGYARPRLALRHPVFWRNPDSHRPRPGRRIAIARTHACPHQCLARIRQDIGRCP